MERSCKTMPVHCAFHEAGRGLADQDVHTDSPLRMACLTRWSSRICYLESVVRMTCWHLMSITHKQRRSSASA